MRPSYSCSCIVYFEFWFVAFVSNWFQIRSDQQMPQLSSPLTQPILRMGDIIGLPCDEVTASHGVWATPNCPNWEHDSDMSLF